MKNKGQERVTTTIFKKIITSIYILVTLTVQILIYYELIFGIYNQSNTPWFRVVFVLTYIIGIIIILRLYNLDINGSYKLTWTILILTLPFFGVFNYLLYGNGRVLPKRKHKKIRKYLNNKIPFNDHKEMIKSTDKKGYNMLVGLQNSTGFPCYKESKVDFYSDTTYKHKSLLKDIKNAKKYIFIEYFIFSDGLLITSLIELLKEKGKEGVEIYIIYDDVGSKPTLSRKTINELKSIPSLHINVFSPYGKNFNPAINYRDHRKIVVIDGEIAYTGGDNLADEYIHEKERFGYWRDNSIKIEGEAVINFVLLFLEMWYISSKITLKIKDFLPKEIKKYQNDSLIMPFGDGPTYTSNPTYSLFLNMISAAENRICISTPYFIIDKGFINAIVRALKSGIEVNILVPHIPDKKLIFYLTRGNYNEILKAGGNIYEYSKGFNHAKNVFVDSKYAYIGTSNIDYRSLFLHFEDGVFITNDLSIVEMEKDFFDAINESEKITYDKWKNRPWYEKVIAYLLIFFSPLF